MFVLYDCIFISVCIGFNLIFNINIWNISLELCRLCQRYSYHESLAQVMVNDNPVAKVLVKLFS